MELNEIKKNFIEKAKQVYGNDRYDYSSVEYVNSERKVIIICPVYKHGSFLKRPQIFLKGHGCPKCNHSARFNTEIFIKKAKLVHGDTTYDYSKVEYVNCDTEVIIICPTHNEFMQTPNCHLKHGCRLCGIIKCSSQRKNTTDDFIKRATEIHGNKYNYSKVLYERSDKDVIIICQKHGEFTQRPLHHLSNRSGCPKCSHELTANNLRLSNEEFIEKAKQMHGDAYDYSLTNYINTNTNVIIICPKHNLKFEQTPKQHLCYGHGCIKCGNESRTIKLSNEEFIEKAQERHQNLYDYSLVNYINTITKIIIICRKHDRFELLPYTHLKGAKCPKCNLCPKCEIFRTWGELCMICKDMQDKKTHRKTKELEVVKFLKEFIPDHEFIHNKSVGRDCTDGHLFPDIRLDCLYYNLIVEVDEYKHRGSQYECDKQRMYDIIAKLGTPCIFIRYNPDSKDSDKDELLNTIEEYIDLNEDFQEDMFDDYGLKCIYLFY